MKKLNSYLFFQDGVFCNVDDTHTTFTKKFDEFVFAIYQIANLQREPRMSYYIKENLFLLLACAIG
jgi:hypothetical protein